MTGAEAGYSGCAGLAGETWAAAGAASNANAMACADATPMNNVLPTITPPVAPLRGLQIGYHTTLFPRQCVEIMTPE
ncbi:hypothetical protein, partial [Pseudomonas viridiflava]|uniref:hypothetical protein n=1 Tax=Pseudomonas viridiflava TaxID=33069 RepID=UPI00197F0F5C